MQLFETSWTTAHQAPLSMELSRQEFQTRWPAMPFSRGSSQPRDQTQVSNIAGRRFNLCTTKKALKYKNTVSGGQWFTPSLPHTHHSCQVSLCVPSSGPDPMGTSPHISGKVSVKVFHTEGKPCPQSSPLTGKG